ncbi:MAG TPA: DNA polymerase Y family protein [Limnobacter sp.]|nr:DNA polymerase Y family protein [Limnobacter sp.]
MLWIAMCTRPRTGPNNTPAPPDTGAALLAALQTVCARYSPMVYLHQDQHQPWRGLLMEIESCLRLFGGRDALLTQIWHHIQTCAGAYTNTSVNIALHGNPDAAWWLAKASPAAELSALLAQKTTEGADLSDLPLHALDVPIHTLETFQQCGLEQLGELRALPRDAVLRRFGQGVLGALDAGFGSRTRQGFAGAPLQAPKIFEMQQELPFHSNHQALLETHTHTLLQTLQGWLKTHQLATRELSVFFCMPHHTERLVLRSAAPQTQASRWQNLLHHQLGHLQLADDVHSIRLECTQLEDLPNQHGQLFAHPEDTQRNWQNTCDTLRARLGERAVLYPDVQADPRPEHSIVLHNTPQTVKRQSRTNRQTPELSAAGTLPASTPRPLWLLHQPRPLHGPAPTWERGQTLQLLSGPERIEFGWWDQQPCMRDYYCAQDQHARQVWIYRDLEQSAQWFIHGVFA